MANIQFEELPSDSDSDIKIFVADIISNGVGFTNFDVAPCIDLAGQITLDPGYTDDCELFYLYVLHELGHVLGLGHSSQDNIMGLISTTFDGLQEGDIEGLRQIYGE